MREPRRDGIVLDRVLRDLATRIVYPPTPDLAARVPRALVRSAARPRGRGFAWRPFGRSLPGAIAALLLIAGVAVAAGIGLRGLAIVFVDSSPGPIGQTLELGDRVALEEAQQLVPYRILMPGGALGEPDEVYLDLGGGLQQVTLLYRSGGASPAADPSEARLLITQFQARPDTTPLTKQVGPGTSVEPVTVAGQRAFWIEGSPHVLLYRDPSGDLIEERVRLVGDALVWQRGELTLRLEGAGSAAEAIAIAESME